MRTRKLTLTSMLTAAALVIFIIEAQLPSFIPIPGIKLGLANIVTVPALAWLGKKEAFAVLILRVVLSSIFIGSPLTLSYSLSGGILAYFAVVIMFKISDKAVPASIIGAIFHNIGQIAFAIVLSGATQVALYLPVLILSAVITGIFTGIISDLLIKRCTGYIKDRLL